MHSRQTLSSSHDKTLASWSVISYSMDRTQDEGLKSSSATRPSPLPPPRASIDQVSSPRLQKKRSVKRVRSDARQLTSRPAYGLTQSVLDDQHSVPPSSVEDVSRQKSTSIRDAVRKIFGRRSKAPEVLPTQPSSIQSTPLRHKAHRSEPPEMSRNTELPPRPNTADRATSASLPRDSPTTAQRMRSPNAVEFLRSRQLKPLVLPAPFEDPRATLRRRKTLPSILLPEQDAKEIAAAIASAGPYPTIPSFDLPRDPPAPTKTLSSAVKAARRRSRSAGDLREQALQAGPVRKRSDEIRFWRESIQNSVLRASGFSVPPDDLDPIIDSAVATSTPPRLGKDPNYPAQNSASPRHSPAFFEAQSASAYGTEISRDLEDRVAKLEANLNFFQRSLQKLQTDRSRRARVAGMQPRPKRDSIEDRSPSMLADDLQIPFTPSQYRYEVEPGPRPSTAPSRPSRPGRPDADVPPVPRLNPPESPPPVPPLRSSARAVPFRPARSDEPQEEAVPEQPATHNATFRSLYRMLTDERSARRQLETQVRHMQTEITDLQQQVTTRSHLQSQRTSYLFSASSEAGAGSARLRDLLGQLEGPRSQYHTPLPRGSAFTEGVVSRFSGSTRQESEGGVAQEEARNVYDSERTPRPEQGQSFGAEQEAMVAPTLDSSLEGQQAAYQISAYRRQQEEEGEMF